MADPLGVAASLIGVIGLVGKVISLGYRIYQHCDDVKQAPKDIQKLMNELHSLTPVLVALRDYAIQNPKSVALQMLKNQNGPLRECERELQGLKEKLKSEKGWRGKMDMLTWPLKEKETERHISVIERQKNLFSLALTMDHMYVSLWEGAR